MIISCKCLNVKIDAKNTDLQVLDNPHLQLGLSGLELITPFFQEDICTVELIRISKEQGSLVQVYNVGNWVIHRCLNCSINTHAIHRERGAACVLVNKAMLTNPADIASLKASSKYSHVFRVVTDSSNDDLYSVPQTKSTEGLTKAALAAIQLQLGEAIQQEVSRVEEKLRSYSEQQYVELEEFRERAHKDHRALARVISDNMEGEAAVSCHTPPPQLSTSATLPFAFPDVSIPLSPVPIVKQGEYSTNLGHPGYGDTTTAHSAVAHKTEKRAKTHPSSEKRTEGSLDAEGLFDLEGMEDTPASAGEVFHSEEEEESEDSGSHDEGIHIPRGRNSQQSVAKSLPVKVPMFRCAEPREDTDVQDDRKGSQDPMDIAASIKALARSVHGNVNVFGELPRPRVLSELPRPRFSTQF